MEPPFVKFDVLWTAVDLRAAGVGPAVAEVEALGTLVAVEDPEAGVGEAVGDEAVERSGVQRRSDATPPTARIEVERVQIAQRGISASAVTTGGPTAAKPTTRCASVATTTLVRGSGVLSRSDQSRSRSGTDSAARTSSGIRPR